ncbi:DUF2231 domain-containing protein [Micromonospora sp. NPDC052213]|uniref:DUF2231 domain-containing protein n=1 Tax=Micromonospora sp. NPDC052213 TaxID=3155812 RepID=UPI003441BA4A
MQQAKRPVNAIAGPYGHPLHPALVTIPIGAWITSLVFDIASHVAHDETFLADGSRWLIAVGVLGALAAATVGVLDLFAIPTRTRAFRTALVHMSINLAVTAAYAIGFVIRGGQPATPVPIGALALSAAALAALTVSGYLGGELTYRYGVRVADETTQADGYRTAPVATTIKKEGL